MWRWIIPALARTSRSESLITISIKLIFRPIKVILKANNFEVEVIPVILIDWISPRGWTENINKANKRESMIEIENIMYKIFLYHC